MCHWKTRTSTRQSADLYFRRDSAGHEVDLLFETPQGMQAVEIKSGSTFASDWPEAIQKWQKLAAIATPAPVIVYGGEGNYERQGCRVLGWKALQWFPG